MRKTILIIFTFLGLSFSLVAQETITVSGKVTDNNGNTLPGCNIVLQGKVDGSTVGTTTNIDGEFEIEVPPDGVLVVSFVGYQRKTVPVEGRETIQIQMEPSAEELEQVVVVGYGEQKKKSVVGAIAQTSGEELEKTGSNTMISQSLQGMKAGVTAMAVSGKPGQETADIQIRGVSTWANNDPLVLVDGVERPMDNVAPNEIESISVLKDASATAVYGVKGANGVILITTKKGRKGEMTVSFKSNFGFKQPTTEPEFTDYITAMKMWNEGVVNDKQWSNLIPQSTIEAWEQNIDQAGPYNDYFPQINWWDEMIKPMGYQQRYSVNVRGGSDFMRYFVSLGYLFDGDIFDTKPTELFDNRFYYKRYNWRANFDFDITKSTVLSIKFAGNQGYRNQNGYRIAHGPAEFEPGQDNFFSRLYKAPSNHFPIKYDDGEWGTSNNGYGNIRADFDLGARHYKYFDGFIDFRLKQDLDFIAKGLSFQGTLSYTPKSGFSSRVQRYGGDRFGDVRQIKYYRQYDYSNPNPDGTYPLLVNQRWPDRDDLVGEGVAPQATNDQILQGGYSKRLYYETRLNYEVSLGDHNLTALYVFSRRERDFLNNNSRWNMALKHRQEDHVGRITYDYSERYLAEVNFAYNGTENFAPGQRFGFFPSASVGWNVAEEPWMKNMTGDWLNQFKVRFSYGQSGNDKIGGNRFAYQQEYLSGGSIRLGYNTRNYWGPLYNEGKAANENVTWEVSTKRNLGFDFRLFHGLTGTVDLYNESRENILMDSWTPMWTLQKDATANLGETKTHGMEIELGWSDDLGRDFSYNINGYVSFNENRIVKRNDGYATPEHLKDAGKPINYSTTRIVNGYYQSLDDIYNYAVPSERTNQSYMIPGDFMFIDYNADGVIDGKDAVVHGKVTYPLNTYALDLGLQYKGWALSVKFYGVSDINKHLDPLVLWDNWNGQRGQYKAWPNVTERWTYENAGSAEKPALHSEHTGYSRSTSTYTYRSASYVRLKNVELSYQFQKKLLNKIGLKRLQVYANGNNLYTWSSLPDKIDPEARGAGIHPLVKRMNVGFRASF